MCFGGGSQTTTQRTETDPWEPQQPYLETGFRLAERDVLNRPTQFFPSSTVVPYSPESIQALNLTASRARQGSPLVAEGEQALGQTLAGDYFGLSPAYTSMGPLAFGGLEGTSPSYDYLTPFAAGQVSNPAIDLLAPTARGEFLDAGNPYFSAMMDRVAGDIRPRIDAQFSSAGRYGSGLHGATTAEALSDAASNLAFQNYQQERARQEGASQAIGGLAGQDIGRQFGAGQALGDVFAREVGQHMQAGGTLAQAYEQERARQMGALGLAPQYAAQDYLDFARLGEVGAAREAKTQEELADQMARYDFAQREPTQRLAEYMGLIGGGFGSSEVETSRQPSPSPILGLLGAASGIATMGGPMGFNLWSDRRLKRDIQRVGRLASGLPVYLFRYLWSPRLVLGVMADEVLKVYPHAVARLPGGWLAVDYARIG